MKPPVSSRLAGSVDDRLDGWGSPVIAHFDVIHNLPDLR
jgi:hypothetical protein